MQAGQQKVRVTQEGQLWRAETLGLPRLVTFGATQLEAERALVQFWRDVVREEMRRAVAERGAARHSARSTSIAFNRAESTPEASSSAVGTTT